jgi:hypothetical protein
MCHTFFVDFHGHKNVAFMPVSNGLLPRDKINVTAYATERKHHAPVLALEHFDWNRNVLTSVNMNLRGAAFLSLFAILLLSLVPGEYRPIRVFFRASLNRFLHIPLPGFL